MYESFFGLSEKPFSITPDPRYLYLSRRHAEALAHLLYGINESGGFIQLTGEVGTGKTTIVRSLLEQLPEHAEVALVLNPRLSPQEFLLTICDELHVAVPDRDGQKAVVDALNRRLLEAHGEGRRVVVIVDEAQNLSAEVLEQVRLLTNLETAKRKLLQIILIGQPELREVLARSDLRQLAQRITGRYHLEPLEADETGAYVRHRLDVAGARAEIFGAAAIKALHRSSGGIPRLVNVIADRALLGAWSHEERSVRAPLVRKAAAEVYGEPVRRPARRWPTVVALSMGVAGLAVLAWVGLELWQQTRPPQTTPVAESAPRVTTQRAPAAGSTPASLPEIATVTPAEAADPGPASPPPVPLAERLARGAAATGTDTAFETLFALWDADYEPGAGLACQQAIRQSLRCLLNRGTWGQVVALNLPTLMVLTDDAGREHQVVLAGLPDANTASLRLGDEDVTVPLGELLPLWFGEYLMLWRPAAGGGRTLLEGIAGPDVLWLRRTLGELRGNPIPPIDSDVFDAALEDAVREFQRQHRLQVDGLAGAMTLASLNEALALPGRPRLAEER